MAKGRVVDSLKEFVALKERILAERAAIEKKIAKLDDKLREMGCARDIFYGPRTPTGRYRNRSPLRAVVFQVLREHPKGLTKEEIYHYVLQAGYVFATKDPLNTLGVILYGKNSPVKRDGKRFVL